MRSVLAARNQVAERRGHKAGTPLRATATEKEDEGLCHRYEGHSVDLECPDGHATRNRCQFRLNRFRPGLQHLVCINLLG
jgi:hypothetical protein